MYALNDHQRQVYRRYARLALPRHTSYPIAPVWSDQYSAAMFCEDLQTCRDSRRPLSLYVHLPFCERLCYYCACTKEIVPAGQRRLHDPVEPLLRGLDAETARLARCLSNSEAQQVHLGGGSPTFLNCDQLARLWKLLSGRFAIAASAEIAVEVDPRITTKEQLQLLRESGFNRISLGIQDFDPRVQKAVNRIQPIEIVEQIVAWCRQLDFESVNFDLIYGLPFQTPQSMAATLEQTVGLAPDRIAFYRLAVIPEIFRWQNVFRATDLPESDMLLEMNLLAINHFLDSGYQFIGLDHFALPDEALTHARNVGSLRRNFQGMTTGKTLAIIGMGPSAISDLGIAFAQNRKESAEWLAAVETDFATHRGLRLSRDDQIRNELMQQLYGHGQISKAGINQQFAVDFDDYFAAERARLADLISDELAVESDDAVALTEPLGRLLVRVVAAIFDRYLPPNAHREGLPAHLASRVG